MKHKTKSVRVIAVQATILFFIVAMFKFLVALMILGYEDYDALCSPMQVLSKAKLLESLSGILLFELIHFMVWLGIYDEFGDDEPFKYAFTLTSVILLVISCIILSVFKISNLFKTK